MRPTKSPWRAPLSPVRQRLNLVSLLILLATNGCLYYTRHTPNEVEAAIRNAGVVGKHPAEVERLLRAIELKNSARLEVMPYSPERRRVWAGIEDARRRLLVHWHIQANVLFDSTLIATDVKVEWIATGLP